MRAAHETRIRMSCALVLRPLTTAARGSGLPRLGRRACGFLLVAALAGGCAAGPRGTPYAVSEFGRYSGYSVASHDGWTRTSRYVAMRDGVRLAVDCYLPTADGRPSGERIPAILHSTRYRRASETNDGLRTLVDGDASLQHMLRHGFAVAVADARGSGASFGVHDGPFNETEARDSYDVIEWLAAQPWCSGRIGMHGRSYPGIAQYHAAALAPPHLKAIFPEMAGPLLYDFIFQGGTYKQDFVEVWGAWTRRLDQGLQDMPARVDEDVDGTLRAGAMAGRGGNLGAEAIGRAAPFRDSTVAAPSGAVWSWAAASVMDDVGAIAASGVAVYHVAGWLDTYATQQAVMYANLAAPRQKVMIGPWVHTGGLSGELLRTEMLRWYDYWLKGVDNGIMDEPPVRYFVMDGNNTVPSDPAQRLSDDEAAAEIGARWSAAPGWPPPGLSARRYLLAAGSSGTVASRNDGRLVPAGAAADTGSDSFTVDYGAGGGALSRWTNSYGARRSDPRGTTFFDERTAQDERALTYTSSPLAEVLVVLGSPVAHLSVRSTATDGDFFVYLEEVDTAGRSHYVTEGALRASHRSLSSAPFDTLGLPFHRSFAEDARELTGRPEELVVELLGTGKRFAAGNRLRLAVAGASAREFARFPDPSGAAAPVVTVLRPDSYLDLPVLPAAPRE
jgi:uncharacterized protein